MKKLLIGASVLLLSTGAFAQTKMTGETARFGLKAGVNLSRFHASGDGATDYNNNVKDNVGFNITGYGDFGVGNNFFIQPGISLQNKGAKFEQTTTVGNLTTTNAVKTNLMVIEVPINAVFRIPTGDAGAVQISAGPYIGFNISGKNKIESTTTGTNAAGNSSSENDLKFGSSSDKDASSTEFGANFGLAYRLNSGFTVGANYGLGLSNLIPKDSRVDDNKLTNRVLGFSVGYSF
ncbi:porin family protein [Pedobacter punctiformis]|uniref:Porin family protein n=1 Tax=Pedobacter punctiformis TaxID=3004097 RepID=A0ABT4L3M2_9SPHI|nr:porin family protein [Pedobacter sp. HCMS5-2]MCZ4242514.1 porin family protein [Pedobacter sp. HCMS5-2]